MGANIGDENPTLTLYIGGRYEVTVTNYTVHPFQVIAKGSSTGSDNPLLSMGAVSSSFESNPGVAWTDNGAGTVTFTMTLDLYNAMTTSGHIPGYRCQIHTSTMRGNFNIQGLPLTDPISGSIQKGNISIELASIVSGLVSPINLKPAPDGTGRLFVADQKGIVYIILNDQLLPSPFLDLSNRLISLGANYDERGLLGIAVHPDFGNQNSVGYHKFYTYTSEPVAGNADFTTDPPIANPNHQSVVAEWIVDSQEPNIIDQSSRREIMRIDEPQANHNAGDMAFGHDGYLYISFGDGGNANDVGNGHGQSGNGQNINTVLGSILRIDPLDPLVTTESTDLISDNGKYRIPVNNPFVGIEGIDEIFAYGFRNPYAFGFDSATGKLILGNVGQNHIEEIEVVRKGKNYGWNLKEGSFRFDPNTGNVTDDLAGLPTNLTDPVAQYDHDEGIAVIGGFIYRGNAIPELFGKYIFGDLSRGFASPGGRLFYTDLDIGLIHELVIGVDNRDLNLYVKGFGQSLDGEIYLLASSNLGPSGSGGKIFKIVDLCLYRIPGDINYDCIVDVSDFNIFIEHWLESSIRP